MARGFRMDPTVTKQKLKPGTIKRIVGYARPYRVQLTIFLIATALDAAITVVNPLLLRELIDNGIVAKDEGVVIVVALTVAGVTLFDALLGVVNRYFSSRIGEGLIYDLRTQVFDHVQRQPLAFFTRAQTGSLVSRLDGDVVGAQQAIVGTLSSVLSNVLSLIVILITLFYLSWLVSLIGLILIPLFIFPARRLGRRLQRLSRESMQLNAEMGTTMTERFNVAGAMLAKLYGRPREESELFAAKAFKVREIGVTRDMYGSVFMIAITLLTGLFTAVVYGVGGSLVVRGAFEFGTLVALSQLLARVYGPIGSLSNVQIQVMTALVSFDRVFEVLDLEPLIKEKPGAATLPARDEAGTAPSIAFDQVSFRYPTAAEVSLASLESIALKRPERTDAASGVLHDVSFTAPAGKLTALVGPSGAGKTTITQLVSRMYDPNDGAVRIGGHDIRDVTLDSLHEVVGVVTQDAHLFHDTIRANLPVRPPERDRGRARRGLQGRADLGPHLGAARRPRHDRRRPGLPVVRRREAASRPGQAAAEGAVHRGPRRGDRAPGLGVRVRRPAGPVGRTARPDVAGHRPPAVHRARGGPDPRDRGRPGRRDRHARGTARGGRPVRGPVPDPVQEPGKPGAVLAGAAGPRPVALLVAEAAEFLARDLLDVGELAVGQGAPPLVLLYLGAPGGRGDRGGDLRRR